MNKAIDWIERNLEEFNSSLGSKALGELCLLVYLYKQKYTIVNDKRIIKFVSFIDYIIQSMNYTEYMVRMPQNFSNYALSYITLLLFGKKLKYFKDISKSIISNGSIVSKSKLQFKTMIQLSYILNKIGLQEYIPNIASQYHNNLLFNTPSSFFLNDEDTYNITHAIFYLTDFGFKKMIKLTNEQISLLKWTIFSLIGFYISQKNWDILAELLICCHSLHWYPDPLYKIALEKILDTQRSDGSIQDLYFNDSEYKKMPTDKAAKYSFRINYHVTILAVLLCFITDLQASKIDNVTNEFKLKKYSISAARLFCSRSYNWIKRLYANLDNYQYDEISLFYFLIGDWIYFSEVKRQDLSELRLKAINIQKKIDTMNGDIQIANVNPLKFNSFISLALVATGILYKLKIKSNRLEIFTRNLPNVLARYYAKIPIEKINLFLLSFLLNKIGVRNDLNLGIQIPIREKDMKSLYIDRDIINNLGDYILAKRLITKKELSFKQYPYDNIHTIIPLSLSNSIRNYDLNLILKLLRTMKYLNKTHTYPFKQAFDFVIEQQNHEGRFGFCLPEISQLRMIDHKFNDTMELYLPLTFSALWTVIEVMNLRFILFDDFIKAPTI